MPRARIHGALSPAVERFHHDLDTDEQDTFRDALNRFVRIYSFLSQIVAFGDTKLERDYLFARALAPFIRAGAESGVDLGAWYVRLNNKTHEITDADERQKYIAQR
ncbi:MAG: hypothetical protein ACRDWA_10790 [Acidimicrobiia bacterium]